MAAPTRRRRLVRVRLTHVGYADAMHPKETPKPRGWTGGSKDFRVDRQDRSYRKFDEDGHHTVYDPDMDYCEREDS